RAIAHVADPVPVEITHLNQRTGIGLRGTAALKRREAAIGEAKGPMQTHPSESRVEEPRRRADVAIQCVREPRARRHAIEMDSAAVRKNELGPLEGCTVANQIPLARMRGPDAELSRNMIARQVCPHEHKRHDIGNDQILVFAGVETDFGTDAALVERLVRIWDRVIDRRCARWSQQEESARYERS